MRRGAKYRRISDDREGRELGIARQDEDLDELGEREGVVWVADYVDNDISASTRSSKPRPDYERMLRDAKAGQFEVIGAYTTGRLTRRPREHEDLIELAEKHGTEFVYIKSPSFDLNTSAGRRIARILAANDAGEAEDIAERVQRDVRRRAEAGEFHGGQVPFGVTPVWGTKRVRGREVPRIIDFNLDAEHVAWLDDGADRLLNGETIYGLCKSWNDAGRRTDAGNLWEPRTLKRIYTEPAIIGKREYGGKLVPAPWPAMIAETKWHRLRILLLDPDRRTSETNQRRYELSGLVFCCRVINGKACGTRLHSNANGTFECPKMQGGCGRLRIAMEHLDRYVVDMLFYRADEVREALTVVAPDTDDIERDLRAALVADDEALRTVADERDDGKIQKPEYDRRRTRIEDRMATTRAKLAAIVRTPANMPTGTELRRVWNERDVTWRRTMFGMFIQRIDIGPHPTNPDTGRPLASAPSRRRGETEEAWRERFDLARAHILAQRVTVTWAA
ncbi:recombinase family protein [Micromonospora sp. NBC_01796]|uniref:recombinase family protein n=1 Tax=Micromonospora sp. NBC_01796 TaxID=2975987 RepID=UPI002DD8397B|nr:recombinase family protein [Micromonospora sp. NBC_01796]WSA88073.1 recombinase family protein [Micromonospora sp. NBC_01796]